MLPLNTLPRIYYLIYISVIILYTNYNGIFIDNSTSYTEPYFENPVSQFEVVNRDLFYTGVELAEQAEVLYTAINSRIVELASKVEVIESKIDRIIEIVIALYGLL